MYTVNTIFKWLLCVGHNDWVISVAVWRGKEPMAVSGSSDGTIKVWDLTSGKELSSSIAVV